MDTGKIDLLALSDSERRRVLELASAFLREQKEEAKRCKSLRFRLSTLLH